MSRRAKILNGILIAVLIVIIVMFSVGYYARGKAIEVAAKALVDCCGPEKAIKAVKKPLQAVLKQQKIAQKQVAPAVVTRTTSLAVDAGVYVPAPVPAPRLLTLRLNVVEWSDASGELFSRDIGPDIRKGMANGSIKRTSAPVTFRIVWKQGAERLAGKAIWINGESRILPLNFSPNYSVEVAAKNGLATIELSPEMIGPETEICVWPSVKNGKFISPPQNSVGEQLPLLTTPGELEHQVKNGVRDIFMHFVIKR